MPPSKRSLRRLLVEGVDDQHTVIQLMARHGHDWDAERTLPYVRNCDGIEKLLRLIPVTLKSSTHLGIIVDADTDPGQRWQQLVALFAREDITLPAAPSAEGIVMSGSPRIGIWLMPNNSDPGALEHFLAQLVPEDDTVWPYALTACEAAIELGASVSPARIEKARMHTWLSWCEAPGRPFGLALRSKYFDANTDTAQRFVAWFRELFSTP